MNLNLLCNKRQRLIFNTRHTEIVVVPTVRDFRQCNAKIACYAQIVKCIRHVRKFTGRNGIAVSCSYLFGIQCYNVFVNFGIAFVLKSEKKILCRLLHVWRVRCTYLTRFN